MERYEPAAVERAMKLQEVILKAMAGQMTWLQAAEADSSGAQSGEPLAFPHA